MPQPHAPLGRLIAALAAGWLLGVACPSAQAQQAGAPPVSPRNANYSIDVELDPASRTLLGRQVLTWRNVASVPATELRFHLYYNAWRNTRSTWMRERVLGEGPFGADFAKRPAGDWGWIEVTAVRLLGAGATPIADLTSVKRYVSPDDGNTDDATVLSIPLPQPVAPGESATVEIAWTSRVPRTFARTGAVGNFFFLAQWFPKIGVLEDRGWNCHQFHAGTEFYADYGVYDVRIKVPRGWIVGATGRERQRTDHPNGTTTHHYTQEDVHDFAWTTSPTLLERKARFEHSSLPPVEMRLLLQPEHAGQADRHFEATRAALRYYGEWFGPYPYGHVTIVDPAWQSGAGGMEYPTLFTAGTRWLAPRRVAQPEGVTVHEAGHQFWYGLVGNNEFEHAWLDEGLNTFSTARVFEQTRMPNFLSRRFFGGFVPWVSQIPLSRSDSEGLSSYRRAAESDTPATPSWRYFPPTGAAITYSKTALWLHTLENMIGWPRLQKGMSAFFAQYTFRHPKPEDFFAAINAAAGQDLGWYYDQVYRSSNEFDYGIEHLSSRPVTVRGFTGSGTSLTFSPGDPPNPARSETTVIVRRYGEAVFPVDVLVAFDNGEKIVERWDGKDRWKAYSYQRAVPVSFAQVDPGRVLLLDVNYTNNSRALDPDTSRATRKWAAKWMTWLQDLMLTYAFFI
jgi:Peptidase family M1 domain